MKVVHVSYARVPEYDNPEAWLRRIDFFVVLLEEMAKHSEVVSIHCIGCDGSFSRNGVTYLFFNLRGLDNYLPFRVDRKIRELQPDVILCHGFQYPGKLMLLRAFASRALIFVQHHSEKPLRHYKHYLQRWTDRFVTGYFFPSSEQAEAWCRVSQIHSLKKVYEVMEVPSVFRVIDRSSAVSVTNVVGNRNYLWVGRFDRNKDPLTLINGFAGFACSHPEARLYVIYQQDDMLEEVESLINASACSNQIILIGKVAHDDLLFWFNSVDFFLSTSHDEGMGIALVEAMSCGCIPLVTRIPSFRKVVPRQLHPYMFEPGDARGLSDSLDRSLSISSHDMRKLILEYYDSALSAEAISSKMIEVFGNCMTSRSHD